MSKRDPRVELGTIIREAREKAKLTQVDLAGSLGAEKCSGSYITKIESGKGGTVPSAELIAAIADALGLSKRRMLALLREMHTAKFERKLSAEMAGA